MTDRDHNPQTFAEMVLTLLEDRFPWLGSEEEVSGANTVQELSQLHGDLVKRLNRSRSSKLAEAR